ncbi:MAG: transcriptional regulator [Epulopiscium sp. Nele67-Bin005]|nr:MAG: transcriptional regulator [Epulopiscium sp. Nele67-Bin005]
MITLQNIADKLGVSRTTVSNVLHGKTKRVSKETQDKISKMLEEEGYVPNMGSLIMTKNSSRLIGLTLGSQTFHHMHALQTPFISEFLSHLQLEAEKHGYYMMIISGENTNSIVDIASRWNIDGLILFSFNEERYKSLTQKLNKPMVLIDYYPEKGSTSFYNIGIEDYDGGFQIGNYLYKRGLTEALFIAETNKDSDYERWKGFKKAQEQGGKKCSQDRYIVLSSNIADVESFYKRNLERFLTVQALSFSSDFRAMEAMQILTQLGLNIPKDISITGFDDNLYCKFANPPLTTIHQDIKCKAILAFGQLMKIINNEPIENPNIYSPVKLIIRNSVK